MSEKSNEMIEVMKHNRELIKSLQEDFDNYFLKLCERLGVDYDE